MSLNEAIAAAREFRTSFESDAMIDPASGFSASHLDQLIDWASTCGDAVPGPDHEMTVPAMDVTLLDDGALALRYSAEMETDPALESPIGRQLRAEVERRGLGDERIAMALEHDRQQREAIARAEHAERQAPPHFPDDLEIPAPR